MNPSKPASSEYTPPPYVRAFMITTAVLVIFGVILFAIEMSKGEPPYLAIGCLITATVNYLYAMMADDIGRTAWQTKRSGEQLHLMMSQLASLASAPARPAPAVITTRTLPATETPVVPEDPIIYQIVIGEKARGPFSVQELRELYAKGRIALTQRVILPDGKEGKTVDDLLDI